MEKSLNLHKEHITVKLIKDIELDIKIKYNSVNVKSLWEKLFTKNFHTTH